MKRKVYQRMLILEAILLLLFFLLKANLPELFSSLMAFPFEQIGKGLRELSLSGGSDNILALVLYFLISLIPVMVLIDRYRKKKVKPEDLLLVILSGVLFAALYYMINPSKTGIFFGTTPGFTAGKAFLGGSIYSVLVAYIALKALRVFAGAQKEEVQKYLIFLLGFINIIFVFNVFGVIFGSYLEARKSFVEGNTFPGQELFLSEVFLFLQHLVSALPYLLSIFIVFHLMNFIDEMRKDRFSGKVLAQASRLTKQSIGIIAITVLSNMAIHVLQLLFINELREIHVTLVIPLLPLIFVLVVLLYTQLVKENQTLKEDNDLFI